MGSSSSWQLVDEEYEFVRVFELSSRLSLEYFDN